MSEGVVKKLSEKGTRSRDTEQAHDASDCPEQFRGWEKGCTEKR